MDQLIEIKTSEGGKSIISARALHEFLEIGADFSNWCKRMIEYGFEEGIDFAKNGETVSQGVTRFDYAFTLDMAKEISMIQRSDKGKQARQYFIECERRLQSIAQASLPKTFAEALRLAADQQEIIEQQQKQIAEDAPKVLAADKLLESKGNLTVGEFAKVLGEGPNKYFEWLRDHKYLISIGAKKNLPYQTYLQMGIFDVKETTVGKEGNTWPHPQTFITPKGQLYLANKFHQLNENQQ
jgi:anti-repressor protein